MSKKNLLACLCILSLVSCKKDYQKLAIDFERALPDSMVVLSEQINEIDHFIYYKNRSNTELIRYDLDKESKESVKPKLGNGERIYGIYAGKENIAFLKEDNGLSSMIVLYNLKTQKFADGQDFYSGENNMAYVNEADSTITGYIQDRYGDRDIFVYDFDGKLIKQEREEEPIGDLDVPDEKPIQNWQCRYCHEIIQSRDDPNLQYARCSVQNMMGDRRHAWVSLGRAY